MSIIIFLSNFSLYHHLPHQNSTFPPPRPPPPRRGGGKVEFWWGRGVKFTMFICMPQQPFSVHFHLLSIFLHLYICISSLLSIYLSIWSFVYHLSYWYLLECISISSVCVLYIVNWIDDFADLRNWFRGFLIWIAHVFNKFPPKIASL